MCVARRNTSVGGKEREGRAAEFTNPCLSHEANLTDAARNCEAQDGGISLFKMCSPQVKKHTLSLLLLWLPESFMQRKGGSGGAAWKYKNSNPTI